MPGLDRSGPRGEGPLTGGRRGLCGSGEYRGQVPAGGYGVGRGGRPWGGGRGRAWGGGRGRGWSYWDEPVRPAVYPLPDEVQPGVGATISGILDRLSQLAAAVADLHERFAAGGRDAEEGADEDRG